MRPSILFLDQQSWQGGGQQVLVEVIAAVVAAGFRPLVALPGDGSFAAELRERGVETLSYALGHYHSGKKTLKEAFSLFFRSVFCGLKLAFLVRRSSVRLVYINGPRCLLAGVLAARLTRCPAIFHLHNVLTRKCELALAAAACRHVHSVVTCSQAAASALISARPSLAPKVLVVWSPVRRSAEAVSSARARSLSQNSMPGKTIGMVGRITRNKGQNVLLRAARQLSWRHKNLHLVFVGAPAPDSEDDAVFFGELQSYARYRCPDVDIRWEGFQRDVRPFIAACDVIVMASTKSEGLGLAALEALVQGVPVVASRVGGISEIVQDGVNGFLVPAGDGRALARALDYVLSNEQLHQCLREATRATIDGRFSPTTFRQAVSDIIAGVALSSTACRECAANKVEASVS